MTDYEASVKCSESEAREVSARLRCHRDPTIEDVNAIVADIRSRPPRSPTPEYPTLENFVTKAARARAAKTGQTFHEAADEIIRELTDRTPEQIEASNARFAPYNLSFTIPRL